MNEWELRYSLRVTPDTTWKCEDCGALVIDTATHDAWHANFRLAAV